MATSAIIATLGGAAVKSILSGGIPPDAGTWGQIASTLISALLEADSSTANALSRVEAKVDEQRNLAYYGPLKAAKLHLRDASEPHRKKGARRKMLEQARVNVVEAISAAPDQLALARAQWTLGVIWLTLGDVEDSRAAMKRGADAATRAAMISLGRYRFPPLAEVAARAQRHKSTLDRLGLGDGRAEATAAAEIRDQAADTLVHALTVLDAIQAERATLGVPEPERPRLELRDGGLRPEVAALFVTGSSNRKLIVGDLEVTLRGMHVWRDEHARPVHAADLHITLRANPEGPALVVALRPLHRLQFDRPQHITSERRTVFPTGITNPLRGPGIVAGGRRQADNDRLILPAGLTRTGWIRVACRHGRLGRGQDDVGAPIIGMQVTHGHLGGKGTPQFAPFAASGTVDILMRGPALRRGLVPPVVDLTDLGLRPRRPRARRSGA